ncbi:MAG TPA: deoxyribonuclease IV [Thermodesulfovibrionales bacterium]|nr:deoxyribonuclease IV [Thermodesulfovibrionales bacterium]
MRRLGVHTSIAGGLSLSLERAHALGCNTMQIFSHNPRGWTIKEIPEEESARFKTLRQRLDISPVYIHTSYLINMASKDSILRRKSIAMLREEMNRADALGADFVILHTGSASGDDDCLSRQRAIAAVNEVAQTGTWQAGLLIENTAGERGDISSKIPDLAEILNGVYGSLISGICFDTCHAFSAGYDMRDDEGIQKIVREIETHITMQKVKLIHLNDSKGERGSGIDRHEHIGIGKIGVAGLQQLIHSRPFCTVPVILETPKKQESDDPRNLRTVRKMLRLKR